MLLITKLEAFNCRWRQQPSSRQWMQPALGNHCQSSLRAVSRPDPGGGGTGRTTELLMALDAAGAEDVIYGSFFDPALAAEAHALGIGAKFAPRFNRNRGQAPCEEWDVPFEAEAYVVALSDGRFAGRLDLLQGHRVDVGPSAARGTHGPRHLHSQPNGRPDVLRNVWNIAKARTVIVKSRGHSVLDASSPLPSGIISSRVWFRKERPLRDSVDSALSSDNPSRCVGQVGCVAVCPHRKLALANMPFRR